jgi:hypothetical protein
MRESELEQRFDDICNTQICFTTLNKALKRMHKNKEELLLALERPDLPLHNNLSEGDIREYVKRRKISGGTRSENGRRGRDTFASLKKTAVSSTSPSGSTGGIASKAPAPSPHYHRSSKREPGRPSKTQLETTSPQPPRRGGASELVPLQKKLPVVFEKLRGNKPKRNLMKSLNRANLS